MKISTHTHTLPFRAFIAAVLAILYSVASASAALRTYQALWSGASFGNGANATATILIDDSQLQNPGFTGGVPGTGAMVYLSMQVSGAGGGDGSWTTGDFLSYSISIHDALNLNEEWVGQPQPTISGVSGTPLWGQFGDFSLFATNGAPFGVTEFVLQTSNGLQMRLTSVAPRFDLHTGMGISNVFGAIVKTLYPPVSAADGTVYARAKLGGMGISTGDDDVIVHHDVASSEAEVIVTEGGSLAGEQLAKLGDPLLEEVSGQLYFIGGLLQNGSTVTNLNDSVLAAYSTGGGVLALVAREGDPAPGAGTHVFTRFTWMHPTSGGVFFGATATDLAAKKALAGVWFWDGTNVQKIVLPGDATLLDSALRVVMSVAPPTAAAPANVETRVGDASSVTLLLKTTTNETVVRRFAQP